MEMGLLKQGRGGRGNPVVRSTLCYYRGLRSILSPYVVVHNDLCVV